MKDDQIETKGKKHTIRKMEIEDVEGVLPIAAASILNPWSRDMLLGEVAHPFSHCFLICREEEDVPLGFICFRNIGEESELLNICIDPMHQKKGLGKRLMEFYIDFCYQKGVKKYYLEVNPQNIPAFRLYQSFAYQEAGKRKKFYQGEYEALVMER